MWVPPLYSKTIQPIFQFIFSSASVFLSPVLCRNGKHIEFSYLCETFIIFIYTLYDSVIQIFPNFAICFSSSIWNFIYETNTLLYFLITIIIHLLKYSFLIYFLSSIPFTLHIMLKCKNTQRFLSKISYLCEPSIINFYIYTFIIP